MKVTDMMQNPQKSKVENQYIAERKFKYHQQGGLTFTQIRENMSTSYGGFRQDGTYFHNSKINILPKKSLTQVETTSKPKKTKNLRARNTTQLKYFGPP